jgi:hypothetical protein
MEGGQAPQVRSVDVCPAVCQVGEDVWAVVQAGGVQGAVCVCYVLCVVCCVLCVMCCVLCVVCYVLPYVYVLHAICYVLPEAVVVLLLNVCPRF